jgi:hypothetical protein
LEAITGVFNSQTQAEKALTDLQRAGIAGDRITLLTPGSNDKIAAETKTVPADTTEQPGMGGAMGALLGGGIGLTGGSILMALIPGVGPVTAFGLLGAAVLGAAGATIGASTGNKVERSSSEGIPEDEIFVYEDALRKGRSVLIALADSSDSATRIRETLTGDGAESVDAAREQWWIGLRSAEESRYPQSTGSFSDDEQFFRLGFQSAMHARTRCMEFDQVSAEMDAALEEVKSKYPEANVQEPFLRGYRRGREHYQQLCDESRKAA